MKAIQITRFGGPDVLEMAEIPVPQPGTGQVLIRVADLLPDKHAFLHALSDDPCAQLRVGRRAELTYGRNVLKLGQTRAVTVLEE